MTPWNKGLKYEHNPAPMEIPKGYTSPFVEGEIALNELWMGEGEFLRHFATKKKTNSDSDIEFNPKTKREERD